MFIVNILITAISVIAVGGATGLGLHLYGQMPPVMAGISAALIVMGLFEVYALVTRGQRATRQHIKFSGLLNANAALSEEIVSLRQDLETQRRTLTRLEDATGHKLEERFAPINEALEKQTEQLEAMHAVNGELTEGMVEAGKRLSGLNKQVRRLEKRTRKGMAQAAAPAQHTAPAEAAMTEAAPAPAETAETVDAAPAPAARKTAPRTAKASPAKQQVPAEAAPPHPDMAEIVRYAIANGRTDLHLQSIVTLPQRKVRFYEALTRLRGEDEQMIEPKDFLAVAENEGLVQTIDNMVLYRAVQVLRRLGERGREVGMFCNISPRSLIDTAFFNQMLEFLADNRGLAKKLIFEFPQEMLDESGPMEIESLRAMHEHGFRFSLDRVRSLNLDFQHLNDLGFRFVKVDADILLHRMEEADTWVHTADLSALMERHGLSLIAEKVENERTVLNLLDYDISLAQGYLFGKPAQVRVDIIGEPRASAQPMRMAV